MGNELIQNVVAQINADNAKRAEDAQGHLETEIYRIVDKGTNVLKAAIGSDVRALGSDHVELIAGRIALLFSGEIEEAIDHADKGEPW